MFNYYIVCIIEPFLSLFLEASREYNEFLPLMPFIATNYLIFIELHYILKAKKSMKSV